MKLPYQGKPIDFLLFREALEAFFYDQDYAVIQKEDSSGFQLVTCPQDSSDKRSPVIIQIKGRPEDFTVEFNLTQPNKSDLDEQTKVLDSIRYRTLVLSSKLFLPYLPYPLVRRKKPATRNQELQRQFWRTVVNTIKKLQS